MPRGKKQEQEKRNLEDVARGSRKDKEARCIGRRRSGKGKGKVLCKTREGKEQQSTAKGVSRANP